MSRREIRKVLRGFHATDGAGVHLVRVLGYDDVQLFDPFLMLDSFDSTDPEDYIKGFPMHPHRGIETVTYLISGRIEHKDSLGNSGVIGPGDSQWMTAGSGILHEEMPKPSERMLGFQLWLNLAKSEKMTHPAYLGIAPDMMGHTVQNGVEVRVLSGEFGGVKGVTPRHLPATILDLTLPAGSSIAVPAPQGQTAFVFLIEGDGGVNGEQIAEKSAVLLTDGDEVELAASAGSVLRAIFFAAPPLHEPVAWGGPIVMNTRAELEQAFDELRTGTFIKENGMPKA